MTMARPQSHPAISLSYNPYSYYKFVHDELDSFIHVCDAPRPSSSYRSPRSRADSIWSTSSICSNDSSMDLALDDRAHDFDDEETLASPISPAESNSSRASWSSMASTTSCTSSSSATEQDLSGRYKRNSLGKPRGPRPLPALPTSQPSSPCSTTSALPPTLPLKATQPLRLNLKMLSPPPSYEEAMSTSSQSPTSLPSSEAQYQRRPPSFSSPFPFDADADVEASPVEFLTSPSEETIIDWQRIEEFISHYDG